VVLFLISIFFYDLIAILLSFFTIASSPTAAAIKICKNFLLPEKKGQISANMGLFCARIYSFKKGANSRPENVDRLWKV